MRRRYLTDRVSPAQLPVVFFAIFICGLAASFFLSHPISLGILWLSLLIVSIAVSDVPMRLQCRMQVFLFLFAAASSLPLLIDSTDGSVTNFTLTLYGQTGITDGSLSNYTHVLLRCMAASTASLLLFYTIPVYQLSRLLRRIGLPIIFVELFDLTYRYIFIVLEIGENLLVAMKMRLGFERQRDIIPHSALLLSQTMLIAYGNAERNWQGLLSRQYDEMPPNTHHNERKQSLLPPMSTAWPTYALEGVHFAYEEDAPILKGINISMDRPEVILLDGDNGAGKSTLLYILAGIIRPSEGEYRFRGLPLSYKRKDLLKLRRSVGLVLQNSDHQLFTPSVEDEIAFGLQNVGFSKEEIACRVEEQIRLFDLTNIRHRPPHLLSEGQKKWVAIAAVLALEPQLVILDEPTAGLDRKHAQRIPSLITDLYHKGQSVIIATHEDGLCPDLPIRRLSIEDGIIHSDSAAF